MTLIKTKKQRTPVMRESVGLFDTRRGHFNFNRFFNGDFDQDATLIPAVNVKDDKNNYEIELAAPGFSKKDFDIIIDDGILTITAEKEQESEQKEDDFVRKEFSYTSFTRSMSLPDFIDEDKEVKAKYEGGVLKLKLDKKKYRKQNT